MIDTTIKNTNSFAQIAKEDFINCYLPLSSVGKNKYSSRSNFNIFFRVPDGIRIPLRKIDQYDGKTAAFRCRRDTEIVWVLAFENTKDAMHFKIRNF